MKLAQVASIDVSIDTAQNCEKKNAIKIKFTFSPSRFSKVEEYEGCILRALFWKEVDSKVRAIVYF